MNFKFMILGIIPARGGSKGLKNKNIKLLLGKPLIYYTIRDAKKSKFLNKIVCSTEDSKIAAIVKRYGIEVIKRPKRLAQDKSKIEDVLRYTVKKLEKEKKFIIDAVVLLNPSIPVKKEGIIDEVINKFLKSGADAVMSVMEIGQFHPNWLLKVGKDGKIQLYSPSRIYRRQDLPKYYLHDGAVAAVKKEVLMRNKEGNPLYPAFGKDIRAVIQAYGEVVDIDYEYDFFLAESILKTRKRKI